MGKLKPVAWKCEDTTQEGGGHVSITERSDLVEVLKSYTEAKITPLYELPEGHVIVPVEKVKQDKQGHG